MCGGVGVVVVVVVGVAAAAVWMALIVTPIIAVMTVISRPWANNIQMPLFWRLLAASSAFTMNCILWATNLLLISSAVALMMGILSSSILTPSLANFFIKALKTCSSKSFSALIKNVSKKK